MSDYDMSIHTNPDAAAWAKFYVETKAKSDNPTNFDDESNMLGWFANAMMAMHDHLTGQRITVLPDGSAFFTAMIESGANAAANSPALESAAATRTATTEIGHD